MYRSGGWLLIIFERWEWWCNFCIYMYDECEDCVWKLFNLCLVMIWVIMSMIKGVNIIYIVFFCCCKI